MLPAQIPPDFFRPIDPPRELQVVARAAALKPAGRDARARIARAIEDGIEWIGLDLAPASEGEIGVAGSEPPILLHEALALAKGRVNVYLNAGDLRSEQFLGPIVAAIRETETQSQVVLDGAAEMLNRAREISSARLTVAGDQGISVRATLGEDNDAPEAWARAIDAGANLIVTDRPEELIAFDLKRRYGAPPVKWSLHRGAGRYAPENTLPAFELSYSLGADFIEFDVRTAKDGAFVLMHDGKLDRTTDGEGLVREATGAQIAALDAGSWFSREFKGLRVPTLDEFLASVEARAELYFDAKDIPPEALAAALAKLGLADRTVVFQGMRYLKQLKSIEPRIRRMPPLADAKQIEPLAREIEPYAFDAKWDILSPELIAACHARGIKVFSDALGEHERVEDYLAAIDAGIDLIQTDHPVRLLRAFELHARRAVKGARKD